MTETGKMLFLLRHADAGRGGAGLSDRDRPLSARGKREAALIGGFLKSRPESVDRVLCSGALRARQTLAGLAAVIGSQLETDFSDALYLAEPMAILRAIWDVPETATNLLVVGHNPGIAAFADGLMASAEPAAKAAYRPNFPTGSLAILSFDGPWRELAAESCRLQAFATPKSL